MSLKFPLFLELIIPWKISWAPKGLPWSGWNERCNNLSQTSAQTYELEIKRFSWNFVFLDVKGSSAHHGKKKVCKYATLEEFATFFCIQQQQRLMGLRLQCSLVCQMVTIIPIETIKTLLRNIVTMLTLKMIAVKPGLENSKDMLSVKHMIIYSYLHKNPISKPVHLYYLDV